MPYTYTELDLGMSQDVSQRHVTRHVTRCVARCVTRNISLNTFCRTHFAGHTLQNTLHGTHLAEHIWQNTLQNTMTKFRWFFFQNSLVDHIGVYSETNDKKFVGKFSSGDRKLDLFDHRLGGGPSPTPESATEVKRHLQSLQVLTNTRDS